LRNSLTGDLPPKPLRAPAAAQLRRL
jgi:hypothetical protein